MTDTANLVLPCIEGSQAQKHVTHNEALRVLDTLVQLAVLDRDLTAPPGSPAEGQRWIVKTGATGAWAGHVNAVAAWQDGVWQFSTPRVGWLAYVVDESAMVAWNGSAWVAAVEALTPTALNNMTLLGVGTTADTTNPLSAKLNNALFIARTVADGGDGHLRYKLSKESAAKTLSFLFQDNYSGRAEIGLTGDDDFHFKVSPDGSTWREAILINKTTGQVSFPQGSASSDLELTLAELSLGVADALNTALFIGSSGNRVADSFDVLTYVNTGAATNLDTGTPGLLKPTASGGTSFLTGGTASQSSILSGGGNEVDGNTGTSWFANTAANEWVKYDLGSGVTKTAVKLRMYLTPLNGGHGRIAGFTLEGSNNNSIWTALVSNTVADGLASQEVSYTFANATAYRYYRLSVAASYSGNAIGLNEWYLEDAGATSNLIVASTAFTAASAPGTARLVARVKEVGAITLNTDLIFSVSRDGGATWTAFAMGKKFTVNSISVYESADLDISGQPTGTSVKWKVVCANGKSFEIHDVYLYWQ